MTTSSSLVSFLRGLEEDKKLAQFCANVRYARKYPDRAVMRVDTPRKAEIDAIGGFNWEQTHYETKSFEQRLADLAGEIVPSICMMFAPCLVLTTLHFRLLRHSWPQSLQAEIRSP